MAICHAKIASYIDSVIDSKHFGHFLYSSEHLDSNLGVNTTAAWEEPRWCLFSIFAP